MRGLCKTLIGVAFSFSLIANAADSQPSTTQATEKKPWMNSDVRLRLCAPAWRNIGSLTPQEAAKKFTAIVHNDVIKPADLHAGNPKCISMKYFLGPYTAQKEMEALKDTGAMAKDKDGNVVKAKDWQNWLVVPDSEAWIKHVTGICKKAFDLGYDGVFTDSMGTAPIESNYVLTKAINPNTGKEYTKSEWLAAESKMAAEIRKAIPKDKILTMNGLARGTRYWTEPIEASPRILLENYDGAMSEQIWREPRAKLTDWPSIEEWMSEIRMIQDVQKRGLMGYWWTKCWTDGNTSNNEPNANVLVPQWRRFTLGSYLLAAGPDSYYNFDTMKNDKPSNAAEYYSEYDAPLGAATGEMTQVAETGVYYRLFENGLVVVNPTDKDVDKVSIPETAGKTFVSWGVYKKGASMPASNMVRGQADEFETLQLPSSVNAHTGLILTASK